MQDPGVTARGMDGDSFYYLWRNNMECITKWHHLVTPSINEVTNMNGMNVAEMKETENETGCSLLQRKTPAELCND